MLVNVGVLLNQVVIVLLNCELQTDFLILESSEKRDSFKVQKAVQYGVPIVRPSFLEECVHCEALVDHSKKTFVYSTIRSLCKFT